MEEQIKMCVSSIMGTQDNYTIYVTFQDDDRYLELAFPECKIMSNKGYLEDEVAQLTLYAKKEKDSIISLAKGINPVKAMMK